jgi:cystathionine beta-lyase
MYNFDEHIDRRGTHSVKWDLLEERYGSSDLLSMWVADSDFKCPETVVKRLVERAQHGVFGYTACMKPFNDAFIHWMEKRHNFQVKEEWLTTSPGIVAAINFAINTLTEVGDKIIIQSPVYPPFFNSVHNNGRILVENPLIEKDQTYQMDFEQFENCIDERTRLLVLCNPHNPIGRVWSKEELTKLGEICTRHDIIVISDEIHSDLILKGHTHTPFASLSDDLLNRTISCYAPSKTFNVAGLSTSIAVIANPDIKEKFDLFKRNIGVDSPTVFGIEALTACYEEGADWLEEQMDYIKANIDFVNSYLAENMPKLKAFDMEGTYLMWLDCRQLGLSQEALQDFFIKDVKVALNSGDMFGKAGTGFMRVNMATTKARVEQFMIQLKTAYDQL